MAFVTKDWRTRLAETVTFVGSHAPAGFAGDFDLIKKRLQTFVGQGSPAKLQQLSELMSQAGTQNRGATKTDRDYRRAAIMLNCAFAVPENQWATFVPALERDPAPATQVYTNRMTEVFDGVCSDHDTCGTLLDLLRASPGDFMRKYKLNVNGDKDSGDTGYTMFMEGGILKLKCAEGKKPGAYPFRACCVAARAYKEVEGALTSIQGTSSEDHDSSLFLTTQFTGCTYCFQINGGKFNAAHLDPTAKPGGGWLAEGQRKTGQQISGPLRSGGGFANDNGGQFKAYGRVDTGSTDPGYGEARVIIISVKLEAGWQVWAQIQKAHSVEAKRLDI